MATKKRSTKKTAAKTKKRSTKKVAAKAKVKKPVGPRELWSVPNPRSTPRSWKSFETEEAAKAHAASCYWVGDGRPPVFGPSYLAERGRQE